MARPSNTDQRREQITRALQAVMAKKGYDRASISEIAAAAGLAAGLVHYHFDSKLEILLAVLDRLVWNATRGSTRRSPRPGVTRRQSSPSTSTSTWRSIGRTARRSPAG